MDPGDLEGVAQWVLEQVGFDDPPIDALDLADLLTLTIRYVPGCGGSIRGKMIELGTSTPTRRVHSVVAHECAHHVLASLGMTNDEQHARYLGAALLVPRRALYRQLRAGWDLEALCSVHVNASAELLARRIVEVRQDAGLALYDRGRLRYRIGHRLDVAHERELVSVAHATAEPARIDARTGAWPVVVDGWRRVLVLAAAG